MLIAPAESNLQGRANTNVGPAQTAIQHPEWTTLRYGEQVMAARGGMARAAKEIGGLHDKGMIDFSKLQKSPARKYRHHMRLMLNHPIPRRGSPVGSSLN